MKAEMIYLLERLQAHPKLEGFQCISFYGDGSAVAVFRHGCFSFRTLDGLEAWLWNQEADRRDADQNTRDACAPQENP